MGLLNFCLKNKKVDAVKTPENPLKITADNDKRSDIDSGISSDYYSSVADSFMMGSSISEVTSSSLLDEILNELPSTREDHKSTFSISEDQNSAAGARDIHRSLNFKLKTNTYNTTKNPHFMSDTHDFSNTPTNISTAKTSQYIHHTTSNTNIPKLPQTVIQRKITNLSNNASSRNPGDSTSVSSSSISSLSSSEEFVPLHPISRSDPTYNRQEDSQPLIDLISRYYDSSRNMSSSNYNSRSNKFTGSHTVNNPNNIATIQRSPGFAITRMKERHRQEYHRSVQCAPPPSSATPLEQNHFPPRRTNSRTISHNNTNPSLVYVNHQPQQKQQQTNQQYQLQETITPANTPVFVVPMMHKLVTSIGNNLIPNKSFSTSTSNNYRMYPPSINNPENYGLPSIRMSSIQKDSSIVAPESTFVPSISTSIISSQRRRATKSNFSSENQVQRQMPSIAPNPLHLKRASSKMNATDCYTQLVYHARNVTQTCHYSENKPLFQSNQKAPKNPQQRKILGSSNSNAPAETDYYGYNNYGHVPKNITPTIDEKYATNSDEGIEVTPEFKRKKSVPQTTKTRCHSVPDLHKLLENEEEALQRKSLEKHTFAITKLSHYREKQGLTKQRIHCANNCNLKQYHNLNNEKASATNTCHCREQSKLYHRTYHHQLACCHNKPKLTEPSCSCHKREIRQSHCCNTHNPKIQQKRKPLLSLEAPSELYDTVKNNSTNIKQQHKQYKSNCKLECKTQFIQQQKLDCYRCHHS